MRTKNMTIAALALLLAACGNEEILENNEVGSIGELVPMTFTAGMPQTRTSLGEDGHAINWNADDEITIGAEAIPPRISLPLLRSMAAALPLSVKRQRQILILPSIPTILIRGIVTTMLKITLSHSVFLMHRLLRQAALPRV